jgi:hypothetical protein
MYVKHGQNIHKHIAENNQQPWSQIIKHHDKHSVAILAQVINRRSAYREKVGGATIVAPRRHESDYWLSSAGICSTPDRASIDSPSGVRLVSCDSSTLVPRWYRRSFALLISDCIAAAALLSRAA